MKGISILEASNVESVNLQEWFKTMQARPVRKPSLLNYIYSKTWPKDVHNDFTLCALIPHSKGSDNSSRHRKLSLDDQVSGKALFRHKVFLKACFLNPLNFLLFAEDFSI